MEEDPENIFVRFNESKFYNVVLQKKAEEAILIINYGDLSDGIIRQRDTISSLPRNFRVRDFIANDNFILVCGSNKYFYYRPNELESSFVQSSEKPDSTGLPYKACEFLSDSTALLYCIYNYHPCDGFAGSQLSILDLKSNKITQNKKIAFSAIALSHLSANWLAVSNNNIYIVNPLLGSISVLNEKLNLIDSFTVKGLFSKSELDSNRSYLMRMDNTLRKEWKRIDSLRYLKISDEIACKSDIYGKSFIYDVVSKTRGKYSFIEFLKAEGKKNLTIVVSRPQYDDHFRDLYFFDTKSKKLEQEHYQKWPTSILETPKKSDDYFIVSLLSSKLGFPYFTGKFVYTLSLIDPKEFDFNTNGEFEKKLYEYYSQKGYTPTIIKSRF